MITIQARKVGNRFYVKASVELRPHDRFTHEDDEYEVLDVLQHSYPVAYSTIIARPVA